MSAEEPEKKNKPENSDFKQQRLKAWQPILTPTYVILTFAAVGLVFLIIGILVLVASNNVVEITSSDYKGSACVSGGGGTAADSTYKSCLVQQTMPVDKDMKAPIYMYYQLSNFYQNHRRYVKSRSDKQLRGDDIYDVESLCEPLAKRSCTSNETGLSGECAVYPCGLIAWSVFNDTFYYDTSIDDYNNTTECPYPTSCVKVTRDASTFGVPWDSTDIAWASDKDQKFIKNSNPNPYQSSTGTAPSASSTTAMPYDNYKYFTCANNIDNKPYPANIAACPESLKDQANYARFADVSNEEFIVWMRTSGLPEFRKLHRIIRQDLKAGDVIQFTVNNVFPVSSFDGGKKIVLSTTEWIGGKNQFLGWAYIVVAILCLLLAIAFFIKQAMAPREPTNAAELERAVKDTGSN